MDGPGAPLISAAILAGRRRPPFPGETPAYAAAREALLAEEIEVRRHIARAAEARRTLPPGPVVAGDYRFRDGTGAELSLRDLFADHETLITYFWMFGPERERPCPMCTNLLGPLDANASDIGQHAALWILGRSPVVRQQAFARERGWSHLTFAQTLDDRYAADLGALTPEGEEEPALVVYRRDADEVRLFWAAEMSGDMADPGQDPRGAPDLAPLWNFLDMTPQGRARAWYPKLVYGSSAAP